MSKVAAAAKSGKRNEEFEFIFFFFGQCIYCHYSMPRNSHKSLKCIFTTAPESKTWQTEAAAAATAAARLEMKIVTSSMFFLPYPISYARGVAHIEHAFHLFCPLCNLIECATEFCVCVRVCLIIAHAAYALSVSLRIRRIGPCHIPTVLFK